MCLKRILACLLISSAATAAPIEDGIKRGKSNYRRIRKDVMTDYYRNPLNPLRVGEQGDNYLHLAAEHDRGLYIKALMDSSFGCPDAALRSKNANGEIPIEIAIRLNHLEAFLALLQFMMDEHKDVQVINGWSLVHLAAYHCRPEMILALKGAGFPINLQVIEHGTPLDVVNGRGVGHDHAEMKALTISTLIESGAVTSECPAKCSENLNDDEAAN